MNLVLSVAVYFVIWWIVLFAVLPFGIRTQHEVGDVVPGTEEGAPVTPNLGPKLIATTIVAAIVFAIVYWLIEGGAVTLDDIPFLPRFDDPRMRT